MEFPFNYTSNIQFDFASKFHGNIRISVNLPVTLWGEKGDFDT